MLHDRHMALDLDRLYLPHWKVKQPVQSYTTFLHGREKDQSMRFESFFSRIFRGGNPTPEVYKRMARAVTEKGFLEAHDEYLPEILEAIELGQIKPEDLNRLMAKLIKRDTTGDELLIDGAPSHKLLKRGEVVNSSAEQVFKLASLDNTPTELVEENGDRIKVYEQLKFENWGRTVDFVPALTCVPETIEGVKNIIKWARANKKKVRAVGYRHTWANLYQPANNVIISLLDVGVATKLPAKHPDIDPENELQGIEVLPNVPGDGEEARVKIGAGTTNEQFRRWVINESKREGVQAFTLPINVVMVEITFGGSNAPICHGAGIKNRTLSDLVAAIEFVNANGEVTTVDDPRLLWSARCRDEHHV